MTAGDLVRRLHQHRMWVNHHLLESVRPLTIDQLHQPFAIGQGSIWKTLTHLLAAEYVWLEALRGDENPLLPGDVRGKLPGNQESAGAMASLDELASRWSMLDQRWNEHLSNLSDKSLDETVYKTSTSSGFGRRHGTKRADVLIHVCTHAQYTTAQLINMLRHVGLTEFPQVMLISLARQETSEGTANP